MGLPDLRATRRTGRAGPPVWAVGPTGTGGQIAPVRGDPGRARAGPAVGGSAPDAGCPWSRWSPHSPRPCSVSVTTLEPLILQSPPEITLYPRGLGIIRIADWPRGDRCTVIHPRGPSCGATTDPWCRPTGCSRRSSNSATVPAGDEPGAWWTVAGIKTTVSAPGRRGVGLHHRWRPCRRARRRVVPPKVLPPFSDPHLDGRSP